MAPDDADLSAATALGTNQQGTRVAIEPHWLTLDRIGVSGTLTATVINAAGDTADAAQVTWASVDTAIATVDTVGVVTAVAFGSTKVTATHGSASAAATVEVALPLTDRKILEIFFEATGGASWTDNTNWLTDKELSEWHGVSVRNGRVAVLYLRDNNLVGKIPPELGGLEELFILGLSGNSLSGPIPPEVSKLNGLRDLYLRGSSGIEGSVPPELGFMEGLQYLDFQGLNLSGVVPQTFASLQLRQFYFDRTKLCFPPSLEAWLATIPEKEDPRTCTTQVLIDPVSLFFETLGDTAGMTAAVVTAEGDTLPDATVTWTSTDIAIATVDSTGLVTSVDYGTAEIKATSASLTATADVEVVYKRSDREILEILYQSTVGQNWADTTNWLSDEPLSEWAGVRTNEEGKVDSLSLGSNNLAGSIPPALAELEELLVLDLSRNPLSGQVPGELGALTQLRDLHLNDNSMVFFPENSGS